MRARLFKTIKNHTEDLAGVAVSALATLASDAKLTAQPEKTKPAQDDNQNNSTFRHLRRGPDIKR